MEYYFINQLKERQGPIQEEELVNYGILPTTRVWCKGMKTWQKAKDVPNLVTLFNFANGDQATNNESASEKCDTILEKQNQSSHVSNLEVGTMPRKHSSNTGLIIALVSVALLVGVGASWLLFSNKNSQLPNYEQSAVPMTEDAAETRPTTENITRTVEITGEDLRLRLSPSTTGETLQYMDGHNIHPHKGDRLQYIGETSDWYNVYYRGNAVYVSKDYAVKSNYDEYIQEPTLVVITGNNTFMRLNDSDGGTIARNGYGQIIYLKKWNTYTYVYESDYYYAIKYNGQTVYVSKYESHTI